MRISSLFTNGAPALGARRRDGIVDVTRVAPQLGDSVDAFLQRPAWTALQAAVAAAPASALVDQAAVHYRPLVAAPGKILCLGVNYIDHAGEMKRETPAYPVIFTRFASTLVGHGAPLVLPRASAQLDYEGELAVVIGRGGRAIAKEKALEHVAGYSIFNDASVRDYQYKSSQWTMGKNFDATGGFGPELVTPDELPPGAKDLRLRTTVGDQVLQDADTTDMIFDVATAIETLSVAMTLAPGDVIVMGTPAGVGAARKPPRWLVPGETVRISIDQIGTLSNPVARAS